jgi:hypothetical protein
MLANWQMGFNLAFKGLNYETLFPKQALVLHKLTQVKEVKLQKLAPHKVPVSHCIKALTTQG